MTATTKPQHAAIERQFVAPLSIENCVRRFKLVAGRVPAITGGEVPDQIELTLVDEDTINFVVYSHRHRLRKPPPTRVEGTLRRQADITTHVQMIAFTEARRYWFRLVGALTGFGIIIALQAAKGIVRDAPWWLIALMALGYWGLWLWYALKVHPIMHSGLLRVVEQALQPAPNAEQVE